MTKIKGYVVIAFIILCLVYLLSVFIIKDQYDEDLAELRKENEKQKNTIESQGTLLTEKDQEIERSRNSCGVNEYENGYIIDGYYYEFKGTADIEMEAQ